MRRRTDKPANHISVATKILNTIQNPVLQDQLEEIVSQLTPESFHRIGNKRKREESEEFPDDDF